MNRHIIEKTIGDLDSILTVLSLVAFENLEPEEMRAVARGGFEMVGRLQSDLEHVLPAASATDEADAGGSDKPHEIVDRLALSERIAAAFKRD